MSAIQIPHAQQDEIDTVLSVMQLSVPQAVQVGFCNRCQFSSVLSHTPGQPGVILGFSLN